MTHMIFSDEPAKGWIPPSIAAPFICILLVAVSLLPTDFLLEDLGFTDAKGSPKGTMGLLLILASFIAMGLAIFAWVRWVEKRSLASIGLRGEIPFRKFMVGLGLGIAMMGTIVAAIALAGGYRVGDLFPAFSSPAALGWIALLLAGFVVQASIEEIAFRGWLFSTIMRRWNTLTAYILTAAAFTFLHFSPGKPLLPLAMTFVFSIFACAWVQRSNSIWGVMGWHTGWNWFGGTGFDVPITGLDDGLPALVVQLAPVGPAWLTGAGEGPEGSVFTVAMLAVVSVILLWSVRNRQATNRQD